MEQETSLVPNWSFFSNVATGNDQDVLGSLFLLVAVGVSWTVQGMKRTYRQGRRSNLRRLHAVITTLLLAINSGLCRQKSRSAKCKIFCPSQSTQQQSILYPAHFFLWNYLSKMYFFSTWRYEAHGNVHGDSDANVKKTFRAVFDISIPLLIQG